MTINADVHISDVAGCINGGRQRRTGGTNMKGLEGCRNAGR